jgi:hypothetical protein
VTSFIIALNNPNLIITFLNATFSCRNFSWQLGFLGHDKTGASTCNLTVRCVRVTVVAVEKHQVLYILSVPVAVVIQHAKRMRRIILSYVASSAVPYFSTLSHKRNKFLGKVIENKMCIFIFSATFVSNISLKRIQRVITINVHRSSCKVPVTFVGF